MKDIQISDLPGGYFCDSLIILNKLQNPTKLTPLKSNLESLLKIQCKYLLSIKYREIFQVLGET
jgi:hypothetical protein